MKEFETKPLSDFKMTNLERGLTILELLVDYPDGLGTSELARLLDLPKNFIFRATGALEYRGFLIKVEESKKFVLSRKMLSMGYTSLQQSSLIEEAMPVMRMIRDSVNETVVICSIEDYQGIVLDSIQCSHPFRFVVDTGTHFDLHCSAPGKAMLSMMNDDDAETIIDHLPFTHYNERTITTKEAFLDELAKVREVGYGLDNAEQLDGVHCLAAPILDVTGKPIAALNVTGPSNRFTAERFEEVGALISQAAIDISVKLGYRK